MPPKQDQDTTAGVKLLRLFRKLMLDGRRHFQADLAQEFMCSKQAILRLTAEIESVIGTRLESGLENRKKWYQIRTISRSRLGLDFEELRYLSVCRDLAASTLPEQIRKRVDDTILNLAVLMADQGYAQREQLQDKQFTFYSKGRIDYTPHFDHIETLLNAIENGNICLVIYKAAGNRDGKEHKFIPNKIISMNGALYVLGATLTKDGASVRHFVNLAVHRIKDIILTPRVIKIEFPHETSEAFGLPWHEPRTFTIHFRPGKAAEYVQERIWADEQQLDILDDGGIVLTITTRSEPELMAWVRSFGDEVESYMLGWV